MKKLVSFLLIGIFLFSILVSCNEQEETPQRKEFTMATYSESYSQDRASSTLTNMTLNGYIEKLVNGNIREWAVKALEENPNIIEQLQNNENVSISNIISDAYGQISSGILSVNISSDKGYNNTPAIAFTINKTGEYHDSDYKVASVPHYNGNWQDGSELLFYVNASEFGTKSVKIGFAFQESNPDDVGEISGNQESWFIKPNSKVYLYDLGEETWKESKVTTATNSNASNGRIVLPANFEGWVAIPLDQSHFSFYWKSNTTNNQIDLLDVNQFQLCIEGNETTVGKTLYISNFGYTTDSATSNMPVPSHDGSNTFVSVLDCKYLASLDSTKYQGAIVDWYDEFAGKLLTGIAFEYLASPSEALLKAGNDLANALTEAQDEDGYLGIYFQANRFGGHGKNWDLWGHYHSIYGLLSWYRITKNETYFDTAKKALDLIYNTFVTSGVSFDSAGCQTMNLAISHAFIEMYKETKNQIYLDTAEKIINEDWPKSGDWLNETLSGLDYYQSKLPRWEALHTICTLGYLYEFTGEEKYYTALSDIWTSIVKTDRHNNGGFTSGEQAVGDPYATGAIETCCTVAWTALSTEYLAYSKNSYVADELELSYFNSIFGSLLDGEKYTTYNTPMEGNKRVASQIDIAFQYNSGSPDFNCCQANIARGLGQITQWATMTDSKTLFVNYYGKGSMTSKTPSGQNITLTQDTEYPLNGAIKITLSNMQNEEDFTLALRIPTWAKDVKVSINNGEEQTATAGTYFAITGNFKNGDTITLNMTISVHTWVKDENTASIYYGPILLASESEVNNLSYEDFKNMTVATATDNKHWLQFTVKGNTFYDFASIGKFSSHKTWLKISNLPATNASTPLWCQGID